jgi:D-alanyl-D-alanine-carboxypeptidase/D-alanyl-D-alanine-endopeptidase
MPTVIGRAAALAAALLGSQAMAFISNAQLQAQLEARFRNDRTGVCVVAAVIDGAQVTRGRYCALPRSDGGPGLDAAFEIGSISKTMTAFLVADLIAQQRWSPDDPIAKHLPPGTVLPRQGERQILVRDLLTHSAGLPALPSRLKAANAADPYADLGEKELLASLADVRLSRPIGSQAEYSNFGMMVVSLAVARAQGGDLEAALKAQLFEPLQMHGAFVAKPRPGTAQAAGHASTGAATPAWTIATNLAGVGMVRASLDDMVKYAQAQLGLTDTPLLPRLRATQQPLAHGFGMNWSIARVQGHELLAHEGGTGGFSSFMALEPAQRRAVVLLADTALTDLGGLGDIGLPLLGLDLPVGKPRVAQALPAALRKALPGDYELAGLSLRLWDEDGRLMAQAEGQPAEELRYDDRGDLYPLRTAALITPLLADGRVDSFAFHQGGAVLEGVRKGRRAAPSAVNPAWQDWAGDYALAPQFSLRVFEQAGRLMVQATAQPAIEARPSGNDRIAIDSVGAVIEFSRDAQGRVSAATLRQNGQVLQGRRQ